MRKEMQERLSKGKFNFLKYNTNRSKRYYVWEFLLNDKNRKIELFHSKISAKRKICYNGTEVTVEEG